MKTAVSSLLFLFFTVTGLFAAENPFVTKFGGPYPKIGLELKKQVVNYGGMWGGMFGALGVGALDDVEGMQDFIKQDVDPLLAGMKPAGPEEEKVKGLPSLGPRPKKKAATDE